MLAHEPKIHRVALACSFALHGGLLTWAAWPPAPVEMPRQQVVEVSLVQLSSPAQEEQAAEKPLRESKPPKPVEETENERVVDTPPATRPRPRFEKRTRGTSLAATPPMVLQSPQARERVAIARPSREIRPPKPEDETANEPAKSIAPQKKLQKLEKQPQATHAKPKKRKPHARAAATPLTTGRQSPNAKQKIAAISKPIFNASYLRNAPPAYPAKARRDGIEGKVLLNVDVTPQGTARKVSIKRSSGHRLLDHAARAAVQRWRFVPAQRDGQKIYTSVIVPVEFRLD